MLQRERVEVCARWLDEPALGVPRPGDEPAVARRSIEDMDKVVGGILLPGVRGPGHGARHTEAGYLMGQGKPVIMYGELEHTMYHTSKVVAASTEEQLLQSVRVLTAVIRKAGELRAIITRHDAEQLAVLAAVRLVMDQWEALVAEELNHGHTEAVLTSPALETLREIRRQLQPLAVVGAVAPPPRKDSGDHQPELRNELRDPAD